MSKAGLRFDVTFPWVLRNVHWESDGNIHENSVSSAVCIPQLSERLVCTGYEFASVTPHSEPSERAAIHTNDVCEL